MDMYDPALNKSTSARLDDSVTFFEQVYEAYQRIEFKCHLTTRFFQIAHSTICLRFTGEALIPLLTRAIAHLEIPPISEPDLTICLVSSRDVGHPRPSFPWQDYQYQKRGEVRGFVNERIYTAKQWDSEALILLERERNLAIYWVEDHERIPYWEVGAPLQPILSNWLSQKQVQLVHAATVGLPQAGVLLVGKGGSGKSTTALSCLNSNLMYLSDDYCLITSKPEPTSFSLYSTGKKNADDLDRLPFLKSRISNPDKLNQEKAVYFIHEQFPDKLLHSCPLKATLIPRISDVPETTLEETSPTVGIAALIPSTIMQIGGAGKLACDLMSQTLFQLPCYFLNVGTDMPTIAKTIQSFIEQ